MTESVSLHSNCEQVAPVGSSNGTTAWVLTMPDGVDRVLLNNPAALDSFEA
ncbi:MULTISPECIES: hypothetical protein [Cyanophyceae]|uniref:hypothetical protein n=1 Tax=Cyanophyceae TaxID=3028117 RepID=UPI001682D72C|nr:MULTISPECIES: hypothetical protein [Cyanophyceae]MBD1914434.1 hypothetical protein [Phormidium sp. FACHB-77]MBD2028843.1 hypothetical protein [Phormidium sp. FACHB-322]MBD2049219.1 hypothetical protein [Leptolyngbya sp. FACHB-60]